MTNPPPKKVEACPFCGFGKVMTYKGTKINGHQMFFCMCAVCGARTKEAENEDLAIDIWNHRQKTNISLTR